MSTILLFFRSPKETEEKGGWRVGTWARRLQRDPDRQTIRQTDNQTDGQSDRQTKGPSIDSEDMSCACVFFLGRVLINKTNPFYPCPAVQRDIKNIPLLFFVCSVFSVFSLLFEMFGVRIEPTPFFTLMPFIPFLPVSLSVLPITLT